MFALPQKTYESADMDCKLHLLSYVTIICQIYLLIAISRVKLLQLINTCSNKLHNCFCFVIFNAELLSWIIVVVSSSCLTKSRERFCCINNWLKWRSYKMRLVKLREFTPTWDTVVLKQMGLLFKNRLLIKINKYCNF